MVNRATALLIASLLAASPFVAHGASLGGIPPEVINQIKSMPPAQQQALAKQYGIDLGALAGSTAGATGPAPGQEGQELTPAQRPLFGADGQLIDPFNPFARDLQAEEAGRRGGSRCGAGH